MKRLTNTVSHNMSIVTLIRDIKVTDIVFVIFPASEVTFSGFEINYPAYSIIQILSSTKLPSHGSAISSSLKLIS